MSTRARLHGLALLLTYALFAPLVSAAPADYPAPRFPQWLVKPSDADLLSATVAVAPLRDRTSVARRTELWLRWR